MYYICLLLARDIHDQHRINLTLITSLPVVVRGSFAMIHLLRNFRGVCEGSTSHVLYSRRCYVCILQPRGISQAVKTRATGNLLKCKRQARDITNDTNKIDFLLLSSGLISKITL